jgi:hypothetical protein
MKRFAGIDIGSERHVVAVVDDHRAVLIKPKPFGEDAAGAAVGSARVSTRLSNRDGSHRPLLAQPFCLLG